MALILAIDEDVVLTMSLDLQLGHVGHSVRRVSTVAQAKAAYNEHIPDVIVIDPTVSEQSGWSLIEQWSTTIPTIVISHDTTDATELRSQMLGVRAILRKPLLVRELIDAIMPYMGAAQPAQAEPSSTAVAPDSSTPSSPRRSVNPTAAERRAARERNKQPLIQSPSTPDTGTSDPGQLTDPLGLGDTIEDDRLLAGLPTTSYTETKTPDKQDSLGLQMRAQRLKRNIPLNQVDLAIGVHMAYLQAMEEDRFSHLPRGRMAEEMITKYVNYLNLDVAAALLQYRSFQYSEPVEPITEYGAANLVVIRYAGIIRTILSILILFGIGYGLWIFEEQRIVEFFTQMRSSLLRPAPVLTPTSPAAIATAVAIAAATLPKAPTEIPVATVIPTTSEMKGATATGSVRTPTVNVASTVPATVTRTVTPKK